MTKRQFREREENRKTVNEKVINQLAAILLQDNKCEIVKQYFERNAIRTFAIYGGGTPEKSLSGYVQNVILSQNISLISLLVVK